MRIPHVMIQLTPAVAAALLLVGCGQREESAPPTASKPSQPAVQQPAEAVQKPAEALQKTQAVVAAEAPTAAAPAPDAYANLSNAFQSADADTKGAVEKAIAAAKAGNTSEALKQLQTVLANAKLTPEQQQTLKDVIAQLQKQMASQAVQKSAADLQKSLPLGK